MSSYMYFYIKSHGRFIRIGCFSRNSPIYRTFDEDNLAPYSSVSPIRYDHLQLLLDSIEHDIQRYKEMRSKEYKMIEYVKTFNNSLEEKESAISDHLNSISSWDECIEEFIEAHGWALSLLRILQSIEYTDLDMEDYLYVGIECSNPET